MTNDVTKQDSHLVGFEQVLADEHGWIDRRRKQNNRAPVEKIPQGQPENASYTTTGLTLSGGGIRSAAFSLGATQALEQNIGLTKIDYLSTVSGGGYIGAAISVGLHASEGQFPFASGSGDKSDNQAIAHIRDHSRYLIPKGLSDLLASLTVLLRGLAANVVIVTAIILLAAGVTVLFNPNQASLAEADIFGWHDFPFSASIKKLGYLALTQVLLIAGLFYHLVWAVVRSLEPEGKPEFKGFWFQLSRGWLLLTLFTLVCEIQPLAMNGLFLFYGDNGEKGFWRAFTGVASVITPFMASASAIFAVVSRFIGDTLKIRAGDTSWSAFITRLVSKSSMVLISLTLPLVLWMVYLHLAIAGDIGFAKRPEWMRDVVTLFCGKADCGNLKPEELDLACVSKHLLAYIYLAAGSLMACLMMLLKPNANSLHRLYRDRLSKAFLFDPTSLRTMSVREKRDHEPLALDRLQLSTISMLHAPIHILNAALNIQGSRFANRRGRNADFFSFSQLYCGSTATGYTATTTLESAVPALDVATVMAVSGAAASSNMGTKTMRGLTATLALLNVRLGYWMSNPRHIINGPRGPVAKTYNTSFYFIAELLGQLTESSGQIYLTDGGHVENLGLYELLRRRCKLIVVVDAEADPNLNFSALVTVERYARIDLGIRIDLPWQAIREQTVKINQAYAGSDTNAVTHEQAKGPHAAIGTIEYGDGEKGVIIYLKASVTGDENSYILDYKRRFPAFPHEATGDQFFSEEQFEVYRALGFHAMHGVLTGKHKIAGFDQVMQPASGTMTTDSGITNQRMTIASLFG